MWAGFPHTDVLLAHAALLRRSSSLCCPHSRHLHSWHSCLQSFKSSSLSLCLPVSLSLSRSAQTSIALLPRDEKKREWRQQRERKRGPYQRRMKEERDQRGGHASRGVMKFVWDTLDFYCHCAVPISSLYSLAPSLRGKGGLCRC